MFPKRKSTTQIRVKLHDINTLQLLKYFVQEGYIVLLERYKNE